MSTSFSSPESLAERAHGRIADRTFCVGVIGLGYVGLPLTKAFWEAGFRVVGFDTDPTKIDALMAGRSYFKHFSDAEIAALVDSGRF